MKKEAKLVCKILSVFLTVLLVLQIAPMQIIADAYAEATIDENTENTLGVSLDDIDTTEPEAEILAEETSKREQYVKHFRMSDGSYCATQYEVPVHFIQDGEWTDYDNTLTEVDADTEDGESASNKDLTNTLADYSVRLSKKTNGKKFVRVEKDGYKLSWYYTKANKVTAQIAEITDDGDETTLEKLSSQVIYEEVYTNTDFEYIVGSEGLKENIILKSEDTQTVFEAEYKANGLTPVQIDDKTIQLQADDGTVIYTISAPYMTDANGEYSNGITLTLSSVKNNKFTVTTTLDEDWLDDNDRAYPVTVDPYLTTSQEWEDAACTSAYIASSTPNTCYGRDGNGYEGSLYVGYTNDRGKTRSLIKMTELPELGVADKVIYAEMAVWVYACYPELIMNLHNVTTSWTTSTVCWNSNIKYDSNIIDYQVVQHIEEADEDAENRWQHFEVTDLVRGWYSGEIANNGVLLRSDKETSSTQARARMLSTDYPTFATVRPVFIIHYRNMSGYEDYWSYTGVSAGRSGAVSVNNFNGNAVFSQPVTQNDGGNLMPVSISLVYNSNGTTAPYTQLGKNMQTNFHIYLREETNEDIDERFKYYLVDADGTKHWFFFEETTDTTGKDEDGLGYTLDIIEKGSDSLCTYTDGEDDYAKFRITDKSKTKMYFNCAGNLIQITDTNGNSIKVTYASSPTRIQKITDGAERNYIFNYGNTSNTSLCTSITDPAGRVVSFTYQNSALKTITFPDGETYSLTFSGALLTQVGAIDGTRTKITYDSTSQKRVKSINWGTSDTNLLESYSFAYKQNETTITDKQGREYTYQFNNLGQTTGIVSNDDGKAQYFDYYDTGETKADSRANKLISESKVLHSVTNYVIDPGFHETDLETYYDPRIQDTSDAASITLDTTKGNLTDNSVKIYKPETNTGYIYIFQYVKNLSAGEYTLSAYVNTEGQTILDGGVYLGYTLYDADGNKIKAERAEKIFKTDGWERFSMPFTIEDGQYIRIEIGMQGDNSIAAHGTAWIDDIQVEKSTGMSSYNLLENSAFTNGIYHWSSTATLNTISDLPGFTKAISKVGDPTSQWLGLSQFIYESGKKDDVFSIGAWIKADSAPINNLKSEDAYIPRFALALHFYDSSGTCLKSEEIEINDDLTTWQFVSGKVIAPVDYAKLCFEVIYYSNINTVMMTGGFCFKEEFGQTYTYDDNGNVISSVDLANTQSSFAFKGDQMAKMLNPSGSRYMYSYDEDNNNLNYALSSDGQQYAFEYDDKGNVTSSKITARKPATELVPGNQYIIVNAYSGKAMDSGSTGKLSEDTFTAPYDPDSVYQQWRLVFVEGEEDVYYLTPVGFMDKDYTLDLCKAVTTDGGIVQIYSYSGKAHQMFKISKDEDNTYVIYTGSTNYSKAIDAQYEDKDLDEKQIIKQKTLPDGEPKESMKWYFYPVDATEDKTISTSATYTAKQNFVATQTDQRGNATTYNYNENTGTLTSVTDASNNTTSYVYNVNNNALQSVTSGGMTNSYTYDNDRLTDINVNGSTRYQFLYDEFGRTTYTKVGNGLAYRNLSKLIYNGNGLLEKQEYGNGDYITFSYDNLDRLIGKSYNGSSTDKVEYFYGADGNISKTIDYSTSTRTKYVYDLAGRLVSTRDYKNGYSDHAGLKAFVEYTYADKTNYLTGIKHYNALGTQNIGYRYGDIDNGEMPDQIYGVTWNGKQQVDYTYDGLGRLTNKAVGGGVLDTPLNTTYSYVDVDSSKTTTLLNSLSVLGTTYLYTYDELGNITSINDGTYTTSYEYDELNQLVRENNPYENETHTYEYVNGNITFEHTYAYTTGELPATPNVTRQYYYEDPSWPDVVTKVTYSTYTAGTSTASTYSVGGGVLDAPLNDDSFFGRVHAQLGNSNTNASAYSTRSATVYDTITVESDEIGNITNYNGIEFEWNGRRLENVVYGSDTISYDYNMDGQRVKKTVNGVTTEYFYNGSILAGQKTGNDVLIFMYDNNGDIFGFTYNGTPYYYAKNAQNDVVAIVNEAGATVVTYKYDAWGVVIDSTDTSGIGLRQINPITYRSYYYDKEVGFYYLNSRYYAQFERRFVSADGIYDTNTGVLSHNMFAYCNNNSVNCIDPSGTCTEFLWGLLKFDCKQASCKTSKNYVKPKEIAPIGTYNNGRGYVYVVTEDQVTSIMENKEDNVVVIVDKRVGSESDYDPNMKILNSYQITKTRQQEEISQLMIDYNTANPVTPAWSRTLDSLVKEWQIHNNVYNLGFYRENTADCDFNNGDEGKGYWDFFVERVLQ